MATGRYRPQRKTTGNRTKLENVYAAQTSLTDTAINSPRKAAVLAIRTTTGSSVPQLIADRSVMKPASSTGTNALMTPNRIAPDVFASISSSSSIGASNSRSNERPFFSKVTVTASTDIMRRRSRDSGTRELRLKVALVGNHPHEMVGSFHAGCTVDSTNSHLTPMRPRKPGEYIDNCGLPSSIGTGESEHLA